ncbi:MAG: HAD hydrolase family protein [Chitinophagaceae bacterium]|jgi:3-deoxy-D-manno-octulosonate 8-phosphate phosphatase (KDO 8-P phosphatase)|nr:HAD hydrolase family protein [Chitinophagaceae bacterium]
MNLLDQFKRIRTFVFDIDGVLTDGTVIVFSGDQQLRRMNIKDGFALQMAVLKGYRVLIISGGNSEPVKERLEKLGVTDVHMSVHDKKGFLDSLLQDIQQDWQDVLYMGDDLPDLELMQHAGISACPADAVAEIREIAKYISPFAGGAGCARDVIEKVLRQNDHWHFTTTVASR